MKSDVFNLGTKIFSGNGILSHNFKLQDNDILFDCEFIDDFPQLEIALDEKTFTRMKSFPFSQNFRKTKYENIQIKIKDSKLTAYSIFFNGHFDGQFEKNIGRGFCYLENGGVK